MERLGLVRRPEERDIQGYSLNAWLQDYMTFAGNQYSFLPQTLAPGYGSREEVSASFAGYIQGMMKSNGVVFACMLTRMLLFSEARFQFRQISNGRPGKLFGTQDLAILEQPWVNGTTGDLLSRAITDADLEGDFFAYRDGDQLRRMRPDWVSIVIGSQMDVDNVAYALDAEIAGYIYHPGGQHSGVPPIGLLPEDVAHWTPIPDPSTRFRGMSWLTPVIREVQADSAATLHKENFFEKGATPNMIVTLDLQKEAFDAFVKAFKEQNEGARNAYKTLFLSTGSNAQVVGSNLKDIEYAATQGAGETRICAAARIPPIIVGLSEGLQAATYSNYSMARRAFSDATLRPLWRSLAASLEKIVNVPGGAELWYDDRDIAFLQEDQKDAADIQATQAATVHSLLSSGFEPDSVIQYIQSGDWSVLAHTGMLSVQLQPPGTVGQGKGALEQGIPQPASDAPAQTAGREDHDLDERIQRMLEPFRLKELTQ